MLYLWLQNTIIEVHFSVIDVCFHYVNSIKCVNNIEFHFFIIIPVDKRSYCEFFELEVSAELK